MPSLTPGPIGVEGSEAAGLCRKLKFLSIITTASVVPNIESVSQVLWQLLYSL